MAVVVYEAQRQQGTGKAFTPQEQEAYDAKWATFAQKMKSRPVKGVRQFRGVITAVYEPEEVENNYPGVPKGTMRTIRKITGEITEPGMEGLRFITDSADNPRNEKTKLYAAYVAVFKETPPPPYVRWAFDYDTLLNVPILLTIEKGKPRDDNKRGGIKAYLVGFDALYDDEDEEATPATRPATVIQATAPVSRTGYTLTVRDFREETGEEDAPWA